MILYALYYDEISGRSITGELEMPINDSEAIGIILAEKLVKELKHD